MSTSVLDVCSLRNFGRKFDFHVLQVLQIADGVNTCRTVINFNSMPVLGSVAAPS